MRGSKSNWWTTFFSSPKPEQPVRAPGGLLFSYYDYPLFGYNPPKPSSRNSFSRYVPDPPGAKKPSKWFNPFRLFSKKNSQKSKLDDLVPDLWKTVASQKIESQSSWQESAKRTLNEQFQKITAVCKYEKRLTFLKLIRKGVKLNEEGANKARLAVSTMASADLSPVLKFSGLAVNSLLGLADLVTDEIDILDFLDQEIKHEEQTISGEKIDQILNAF